MNYLITEEQLKFLTESVKNITEGTVTVSDPKYSITAKGDGWLRDSRGKTMCVKVEAGFPWGTFAQGIQDIYPTSDGIVIKPTQSKIGDIDMTKTQLRGLANSVLNGKAYTFNKSGAKITIGANIVDFCKKDWGIK